MSAAKKKVTKKADAPAAKRRTSALRLYGWLDPNPNNQNFAQAAYSSRDGRYHVRLRYRLPGEGTIVTEKFDAASADEVALQASSAQHELTDRRRRGVLSGDEQEATTLFADHLGRYVNEHVALRKAGVIEKEPAQINKWITPFLGGFSLAELKADGPRIGAAWVEWMRSEQNVSWVTRTGIPMHEPQRAPAGFRVAEQAVEIATAILNVYAKEFFVIRFDRNPLAGVQVKRKRGEQETVGHLEEAIPLSLVETVAFYMERLQDVVLACLLGELGLRQQEAHVLHWSQLLWPDGTPRTSIEVLTAVSGTGRNREIGEPKSRTAYRRVTLHPPTADLLLLLWDEQGRPPIEAGSLVFPGTISSSTGASKDGLLNGPGWRVWKFNRSLKTVHDARTLTVLTKLHGKLTPHRFRSAAASASGMAGISHAEAMLNFGWSRIDTMMLHYERAIADPDPQLRGMPVAAQIIRARRIALDEVPAIRTRLTAELTARTREVGAPYPASSKTPSQQADERRKRLALQRDAQRKLTRCDQMERRLRAILKATERRELAEPEAA